MGDGDNNDNGSGRFIATADCHAGEIILDISIGSVIGNFTATLPDGSTQALSGTLPLSLTISLNGTYTFTDDNHEIDSISLNVNCDNGGDSITEVLDCVFNLNERYENLECVNDKRAQEEKIKLDRAIQLVKLAEYDLECGMGDIYEYISEIEEIGDCEDCDRKISIHQRDTYGCTDDTANNYNSYATVDDGSCDYSQECVSETMPNRAPWNGAAQTKTSVPDPIFEAWLELSGYGDGALNGEVCTANINTFHSLVCVNFGITDATGIGDMVNNPAPAPYAGSNGLVILRLQSNKLSTIDVSQLLDLISLSVDYNVLTSVTGLTNLIKLQSLDLERNLLSSIDISANVNLEYLQVRWNDLTSLDISNNVVLKTLTLHGNKLTSIDLSNNPFLQSISLGNQQSGYKFTSLDVTNNVNLKTIDCYNQSFTTLDVSMCTGLTRLHANDNPNLATLNLGSNINLATLSERFYDCKSNLNIKVGTGARVTEAITLWATLLAASGSGYSITT